VPTIPQKGHPHAGRGGDRSAEGELIIASRILDAEDLARPLGHISARIPGTETFLITRSLAPGLATVDDLVVCDLNGNVIEGKYSRTFGEVWGHAGVYRKRSDVQSVAHTHSWNVMALSMTETTVVPAFFESMRVAHEPIALYKKLYYLDSPEVAEEVAGLIGPNKAVILKGHGAVVVGKTVEEATVAAIDLERAAKVQLMAESAGALVPFLESEKEPMARFLREVEARGGTNNPYMRAWEYYRSKVA
jgi:ribulose-5-phosphate 4-epimerase/fuculose-1-phosphate aldolase